MAKERRLLTRLAAFAIGAMVGVAGLALGTEAADAAEKAPAKVKNLKVTAIDYHSAKVTWKKAKDAKKYEVYRAEKKNGTYKKVKTTTKAAFTDNKLKESTRYYFKVRAVNGKKKGVFSTKKSVLTPMMPIGPAEFTVAAGDDQTYAEFAFPHDITITLDPAATIDNRSQILFENCRFDGSIKVIGDRSAFVRFGDGCIFGENCEITVVESEAGATEGMTKDDDLVKVLFAVKGAPVNADSICNVICANGEEVVVDGKKYLFADFPDCEVFYVVTYFENGEKKVYTEGE